MGLEIENTDFTEADFATFSIKLRENLQALEVLLAKPGFGEDDLSFGAELELYIVDKDCRPLHINQEIRGGPFTIAIEGEETLQLAMEDVILEGARRTLVSCYQADVKPPAGWCSP